MSGRFGASAAIKAVTARWLKCADFRPFAAPRSSGKTEAIVHRP
jgi:hypothetical protein